MTIAIIAAIWIGCGLVGSVFIAIWWTDELPLTTDEVPGLLFGVVIGPFNLAVGIALLVSVLLKRVARMILPAGRRVILRQWGRF